MKKIQVVAAIIEKEGEIFATQRGYGTFKDMWEFPGGKIEQGETPEEALVREIQEELESEIVIKERFDKVEYQYPDLHVTLYCYLCELHKGELRLLEHEASKWLKREELDQLDWLPADIEVIEKLKKRQNSEEYQGTLKNIEGHGKVVELWDEESRLIH